MGGQMHPCFYQCKVPCGGLYSSGGGNQVDDCIQQQGNIHGRQAELFPKTLTGHSRALEAVFVREDKQREEYQRQPQGGKAGPRHNRGVCLQRQQRLPEG